MGVKIRTLLISDLHIGNSAFDEHVTIDLLQKEEFDTLILNGDIVDLWLTSMSAAIQTVLFKLIESLSRKKLVFWVLGNHDAQAFCSKNSIIIVNQCILNSGEILVVHGHQAYRYGNDCLIDHVLNKIVFWTWGLFGCDLQVKLNKTRIYQWYINRKRLRVLKLFPGFKHIIMGHTHIDGVINLNNTTITDLGSCPITRSYAIIENNCVILKHF